MGVAYGDRRPQWAWPMAIVGLSGRGHFPNLHTVVHLVPGSVGVAYGDRRPIIAQWVWPLP